jgi:hypothetical protein
VIELDEESWLAMESGLGTGGSVKTCNSRTWVCTQVATGLPMLTSVVIDGNSWVWPVTNALDPTTSTSAPGPERTTVPARDWRYSIALTMSSTTFLASPKTIIVLGM